MSIESLDKEITTIDEWGFEIKQWFHWLPESKADLLNRLEMNQAFYRYRIELGTRFPKKVNEERSAEFKQIQELKNVR